MSPIQHLLKKKVPIGSRLEAIVRSIFRKMDRALNESLNLFFSAKVFRARNQNQIRNLLYLQVTKTILVKYNFSS